MTTTILKTVSVTATLTVQQAEAFSEFLKRVGLSHYETLAVDSLEAYSMLEAGEIIRSSLAEQGFSPR